MKNCNREHLVAYLVDGLDEDDKLDFLLHVENCPSCWDEVYLAVKSQHSHYYKGKTRRNKLSEREIKGLKQLGEELFEVA